MAGTSTVEVFDCSVEDFYKIISDYESYSSFLDDVKACEVIREEGQYKYVEYTISIIKTFKYVLKMDESQAPHKVTWEFVEGDLFKSSSGSWVLQEEAGKTRAEYNLEAKFGVFVPGPVTKAVLSVNLPNMMSSYQQRVAELY